MIIVEAPLMAKLDDITKELVLPFPLEQWEDRWGGSTKIADTFKFWRVRYFVIITLIGIIILWSKNVSRRRILVVDDEPSIVRPLTFILKKKGYEVLTASNGEEGLNVARMEKPDLIFLDVMMPKKNGYEVCEELKSDPEFNDIYIIILTARGVELDEEEKRRIGANEFMSKPFSPIKVVEKVNSIL